MYAFSWTAYARFAANLPLQFADILDEPYEILNLLARIVHHGFREDIATLTAKADDLIDHALAWQQIHAETPVLEALQDAGRRLNAAAARITMLTSIRG